MPPSFPRHARTCLASALLALCLTFLLFPSCRPRVRRLLFHGDNSLKPDLPDFDQYVRLRTLGEDDFPTSASSPPLSAAYASLTAVPSKDSTHKRVIIVGDIHGQQEPLDRLLSKLAYTPTSDTLLHVGDIITKSPLAASLAVLDFMRAHNVSGVRGNNDQKVIGWRAWRAWVSGLARPPGYSSSSYASSSASNVSDISGRTFLAALDAAFPDPDTDEHAKDVRRWLRSSAGERVAAERWAQTIPEDKDKDWTLLGRHYKAARALRPEHAAYLRALPLVMHAPEAHTFVVHAGLLPYDPTHRPTHREQPLSHWPSAAGGGGGDGGGGGGGGGDGRGDGGGGGGGRDGGGDGGSDEEEEEAIRKIRAAQEHALLADVPQNGDAWAVMNMRGVTRKGKVTSANGKGTPWAGVWCGIMERCSAEFEREGDADTAQREAADFGKSSKKSALPCYPSTVVYGHASKRGLDIGRWTVGLDSGCTYGGTLSALVLDYHTFHPLSSSSPSSSFDGIMPDPQDESGDLTKHTIPYGDNGLARVYSVKCTGS
ncbi:Metallo-dependent phosphatase [Coniophora puteana RWD-64-598 SS2]|uniref:Metallo-dependent phosphatase n=1 Tax=Coniophora puteana (strain RWD-64-598) TaxID=741705 RepID=A0A5M3MZ05_CONPW|nr:Metallo-dependent phosphatase [Coniophora puteana RWD-64-598 SS2]EIW84372.1 Metallo-dependent phosphatase [Coniophora puteana RWD-64-598 SS2]